NRGITWGDGNRLQVERGGGHGGRSGLIRFILGSIERRNRIGVGRIWKDGRIRVRCHLGKGCEEAAVSEKVISRHLDVVFRGAPRKIDLARATRISRQGSGSRGWGRVGGTV